MSGSPRYRPCPALREGQRIAVVAPAGPVPEERLRAGLDRLSSHYELLVADDLFRAEGFLAGGDERRAEEMNAALRDPDVRAIWVARGGYGCSRIVDALDRDAFLADPKPIIGFSDVTVLHAWVASLGYRSIHGPVLTQLAELRAQEQEWVVDMVSGRWKPSPLRRGLGPGTRSLEGVEGTLVGGCLSLVTHISSSETAYDFEDSLLLIEDVGEKPYALDRYLTQLLRATGKSSLRRARGVLLGDFARCEDALYPELDGLECIEERLGAEGIPWTSDLPVGHGERNMAFPVGACARVDAVGVHILDPAVERSG